MSSVPFDPYHKWLGIPQRDQPAHHYRLLGIPLYEDDVQVVEAAADRQMAFLRKFQTGEHSADALKLLNEVSRARICLLKPEAKAAYDETLRATLMGSEAAPVIPVVASIGGFKLPPWATPPVLAGVGVALVVLMFGMVLFLSTSKPAPQGPSPVIQAKTPDSSVPPGEMGEKPSNKAPVIAAEPKVADLPLTSKTVPTQTGRPVPGAKTPSPTVVASNSKPESPLQTPSQPASDKPALDKPGAAKMSPPAGASSAVDLLARIDVDRNRISGRWKVQDGKLLSAAQGNSRLQVPYVLPDEYDLVLRAERIDGDRSFGLVFPVQGHPAQLVIDGQTGNETRLRNHAVDNPEEEPTFAGRLLQEGQPLDLLIQVRRGRVAVAADKKEILNWKGDAATAFQPTLSETFSNPNPRELMLVSLSSSFRVSNLEFRPPQSTTFASATDPSDTPRNSPADSEKPGGMPADSGLETQKLPTPDAAAQESARMQVRDSLKLEYALAKKADGKNHDAKINLAKTLMSRVESSDSNPAESYVMLSDAAEFAAESGQLSLAFEILNELGDRFDVPSLPLMERAAKAAGKFAKTDEDTAYLASMYVLLLDEAVRLDDYETASKAAPAAAGATRKNAMLKEQLAAHTRRINGLREAFELAKPAREVLKVNPNDETANLAWGRYVCFYKRDWLTGLPLLAKSSDAALASLAKREVEQPRDLQPLIQLGDDWWDVAEEEKEPVRSTIRERAADAWQLALPLASGLQKKELETKVERIFKPTKFFETTGSGQGISVASPDLHPGPFFTVEFWVATQSKSGILISKREDRRDSGIVLGMDRGRPAFRVGRSSSESQTGRSSRQAINDGRWHHVAVVKLGSRLGLFVDGKWTAQTEYADTYLSGSPWKVGHDGQSKQAEPAAKFCRLRFSKEARYLLSFHPEKNYARDKATTFIP